MTRFIGFLILGGVFTGLFFLIRDFLDNPTASERELANPAGQFAPNLSSTPSSGRPRPAEPAGPPVDPLTVETRGFRVTAVIHHREKVFFHQSEREANGLPRTFRTPERAFLVTEGVRSRLPATFAVDPDIAQRTPVGFVILLSRARTLPLAQDTAEPQPPSGFATTMPRNPGTL